MREEHCWNFEITPRDIQDIIQAHAFTRTFYNNIRPLLPPWIQFRETGNAVIGINDLRTEIQTAGEINSGICKGAPLIANRVYTVLHLGHGFSVDIYGQDISLPNPLANRKYCFIADICQNGGSTMFIVLPEASRDIFENVSIFTALNQTLGLEIRPIGIGISLDKTMPVNWETNVDFWRGGDELFTYP
ncbi:hypothetical protein DPMN_169981 [Dreissena polymorpha]|uniref:Uncharacterized protein n=2 Tax=Dreissena polymorpha TaxID=45954 RepID=A0A9D4DYP2_DREPO|nr:hypothetical protein DPMN_169981 [Dreissena polymorpha]